MYGYTPPTVIAIDGDLLEDFQGHLQVAEALRQELARKQVWAVIFAPGQLADADADGMAIMVEGFYDEPRHGPDAIEDIDLETTRAVQHHLRRLGIDLAIRPVPGGATPHSPASALVAGGWKEAAGIARMAGSPCVVAWTRDERWVPPEVDGVPFVARGPGGPGVADLAGAIF